MTAPADSPQDFADWLPPMLVKELRQGLKTHEFAAVFVLAHIAMITLLGLRLSDDGFEDSDNLDRLMWLALAIVLLVLMPLRGIAAISSEEKAKTLDLVQLTHLSSMRIVWGKWVALVSQTLLLLIAVLPYWVLRYFFGGVDVVQESRVIGWMLFISLPLTAVYMAVSPASMLARLAALGVVGFFTLALASDLMMSHGVSFGTSPDPWAFLFAGTMSTAFALSVAAARISAVAENASATMRGIALLAAVSSLFGGWIEGNGYGFLWTCLICPLLACAALEAMTERACELPVVYVPWLRRGRIGRLAVRVLYPGWGTGLVFVALITLCLVTGAWLNSETRRSDGVTVTVAVAMGHLGMAMLFPAVGLCLLPRLRQRHWFYVVTQIACGLWFVLLSSIEFQDDLTRVVCDACTPLSAFFWLMDHNKHDLEWTTHVITAGMVDAVILVFLFYHSRAEFRTIRRMEQKAALLCHAAV